VSKFQIYYNDRQNVYHLKLNNMLPSDEAIANIVNIPINEIRIVFKENFNATCGDEQLPFNGHHSSFPTSDDIIKAVRWLDSMLVMGRLRK
jgi:hypothetical protein